MVSTEPAAVHVDRWPLYGGINWRMIRPLAPLDVTPWYAMTPQYVAFLADAELYAGAAPDWLVIGVGREAG